MHPRSSTWWLTRREKGSASPRTRTDPAQMRRAEACVASGLDFLHVSIDGATAETYERIRVRSHLDKVVRNLGLLRTPVHAEHGCRRCAW